jgi:hypothetical protein
LKIIRLAIFPASSIASFKDSLPFFDKSLTGGPIFARRIIHIGKQDKHVLSPRRASAFRQRDLAVFVDASYSMHADNPFLTRAFSRLIDYTLSSIAFNTWG